MSRSRHIHLGVIKTPSAAAQKVADLKAEGGIRPIWPFAPVHLRVPDLRVPESVVHQNQDLCPSPGCLPAGLAIATAPMEAAREAVPIDAQPEKAYAKED
jgi:redox-sensing transcriptional repressor